MQKSAIMRFVPFNEVTSMFGYGGGTPTSPVTPVVTTIVGGAGITMLPNTGASVIFVALSYITFSVGLAIAATTVARMLAAKRFNA